MPVAKKAVKKAAAPPAVRLSDNELRALARRRKALQDKAKAIKERLLLLDEKIIREMDARDTKTLEGANIKVTVTRSNWTEYNYKGLLSAIGPTKMKLIRAEKVDKDRLMEAIAARKIDPVVVSQHTQSGQHSPYVTVS